MSWFHGKGTSKKTTFGRGSSRLQFKECKLVKQAQGSIVIVNSRFLERPQKRSRRNQLIHRPLIKNKIDRQWLRSRESGRQKSDGYGGWCLELRRGGRYEQDDKSG